MKHYYSIIVIMTFFVFDNFGSTVQDSVFIDINKVHRIINAIKEKQEPKNYYIFDTNYFSKDITYSYPTKVTTGKTFVIMIKWEDALIYEYVIDLLTYEIKTIIDLR